jgi:hypothetical protein
VLAERLRREVKDLERQDAERMMADAAQARGDSERRREYGARYADAFAAFGTETPPPVDDETPGQYIRRLYERLRHRLPSGHDLANVRADDLPAGPARTNFERLLIQAAIAEGLQPSRDNLPPSGELVPRVRGDPDSGARETHWYGRRSFIKDLSREGRRVLRLVDPRTGNVLMGQPFSRAG